MRKFLSAAFYLLWGLPILMGTLGLFGTLPWALDRTYYHSLVEDDRLYRILESDEWAAEEDGEWEAGGRIFHAPTLVRGLQRRLPERELRDLGAQGIDQSFDYIQGLRTDPPQLDLRPLKAALDDRVEEIAAYYVVNAPRSYLPSASASAPAAEVNAALERVLAEIPDTAAPDAPAQAEGEALRRDLTQFRMARTAAVMAVLAAASLTALAFLGGGGSAAMLARAGAMLGFPSALAMLFGLLLALPGASFLLQFLPPQARDLMGTGLREQARAFLAFALAPAARSFFLSGLVGASLAALLKRMARYSPREEEEE